MKDLADELVASEMEKIANDRGIDLDVATEEIWETIEDEAVAIVEDLLEVEYARDLESRLARERVP